MTWHWWPSSNLSSYPYCWRRSQCLGWTVCCSQSALVASRCVRCTALSCRCPRWTHTCACHGRSRPRSRLRWTYTYMSASQVTVTVTLNLYMSAPQVTVTVTVTRGNVCVYIDMSWYMYTSNAVCAHVHRIMCVLWCVYTYTHTYIHKYYIYVCIYMYIYIYIYIYTHTHTHTYISQIYIAQIYIHTHTHTYTRIYICASCVCVSLWCVCVCVCVCVCPPYSRTSSQFQRSWYVSTAFHSHAEFSLWLSVLQPLTVWHGIYLARA